MKDQIILALRIVLFVLAGRFAYISLIGFSEGKDGEAMVAASFASLYALNGISDLARIWSERNVNLGILVKRESMRKQTAFRIAGFLTSILFFVGIYLQWR
jgi:hypothetical protein